MNLKMTIPKGRMQAGVVKMLQEAGIRLEGTDRNYRPQCSDPEIEIKVLKSQNIPPLVDLGQHDCGFAGADWIAEQESQVFEVLDLELDPVRIVACAPEEVDLDSLRDRRIIAVSEYQRLCESYLREQQLTFTFLRSYGATEVFPPEDADLIVDNSSTGITLKENRLHVLHVLMKSSTRFIANYRVMEDPDKRRRIEDLALLFRGILAGRKRVLLEMNCSTGDLKKVVDMLPAMKSPTVSKLYAQEGFAVKAAVPSSDVNALIPRLRAVGATDILETPIRKVLP